MNHFDDKNIEFWIKNGLNVLLRGRHGVGKTARVLKAWEDNGLKYQYFSASTMDPWVDFIGVPKERTDENGNSYLDLVRPKNFQNDEVEAIFLDEFNRSSKKVRNAVMELIQFKSINGKKFKNLKIIWAAINPDEDDEIAKYDVEALDPAQMDRFHIIIDVAYRPDAEFFRTKYGQDHAEVALSWWGQLKDQEKRLVSPRRLDYLLDIFSKGGDIKPALDTTINAAPLLQQLSNGPIAKQIERLVAENDMLNGRKFIQNENNYNSSISTIIRKPPYIKFFTPLMPLEKLTQSMNQYNVIADHVFGNYEEFKDLIKTIAASRSGNLSIRAVETITRNLKPSDILSRMEKWTSKEGSDKQLMNKLRSVQQIDNQTTSGREIIYQTFEDLMPAAMSHESAEASIAMLAMVMCHSQRETILSKMPKLPSMLSHAIEECERLNIPWKTKVDHKAVVNKIIDYDSFRTAKAVKGQIAPEMTAIPKNNIDDDLYSR